jgi:hypothetical protein
MVDVSGDVGRISIGYSSLFSSDPSEVIDLGSTVRVGGDVANGVFISMNADGTGQSKLTVEGTINSKGNAITLNVQPHVGRIVRMKGIVHACLHESKRMAWPQEAPGCAWSPAVALSRVVLEGTILQEFGKKTAVGTRRDVLEEDADEFIADSLTTSWCCHGFLCHDGH